MAKTLLRGLELIEAIGQYGPLTVAELAARTGVELTAVYRTVAACEPDGWLIREAGKVQVGPRCALLGLTSSATAASRRAEPLVRAIAGATGLNCSVSVLVGRDVMALAQAAGTEFVPLVEGLRSRVPPYLLADGRAIATQLAPAELARALPPEPYPDAAQLAETGTGLGADLRRFLASTTPAGAESDRPPATHAELVEALAEIRRTGFARDTGQFHPTIHCIARPWPAIGIPAAIACVGSRAEITRQRALIEACLVAATEPGAGAQDVINAAARPS